MRLREPPEVLREEPPEELRKEPEEPEWEEKLECEKLECEEPEWDEKPECEALECELPLCELGIRRPPVGGIGDSCSAEIIPRSAGNVTRNFSAGAGFPVGRSGVSRWVPAGRGGGSRRSGRGAGREAGNFFGREAENAHNGDCKPADYLIKYQPEGIAMQTYKKPLGRSIAVGCILFMAILCLALSILNYLNQRHALYQRYQSYITDILRFVDRHIDDEDLKQCIETTTESETYKQTLRLMDEIMNEFSIHYLYAIKPLNRNETGNVMSVFSAEDDYNRYVDTEGNLYLGWISEDEYDAQTVDELFAILEQDEIVFFVERTGWSTDYTGAMPLRDAEGTAYAILCVDVDITALSAELWGQVLQNSLVILFLGLLYTVCFLWWTKTNITHPVRLLEKGVVEYAGRSHGQRDVEALKFEAPNIRTDNEVESLSRAITRMTEDMQDYVNKIITAEEKTRSMKKLADDMRQLAIVDTLTGIRNKTAFVRELKKLEWEQQNNPGCRYGLCMVDLNYLKYINDNFGHEKGDDALRTLSKLVCTVFTHSPVFRVGGDEFVVVLRGHDLQHAEELKTQFLAQVSPCREKEPWRKVSAAIGIACYDPAADAGVEDVLKRADQAMYAMKKGMKATRDEHR